MRQLKASHGIILAALIFTAECLMPANVLLALLYIVALLIGPLSRPRDTWLFAALLATLTLLAPLVGPKPTIGATHWVFWTNRVLAAFVILFAASLIERMRGSVVQRDKALSKLADAVKAREIFLASLAHELRNPLAPLRLGLEMSRQTGEQIPPRMIDIMTRQLSHLIRLVDDLLELSRIRGGKLVLKLGDVDLASLLQSALETQKEHIEKKQQSIELTINTSGVISGDEVRLSQVLTNLIGNASKFTPVGGAIEVSLNDAGEDVVLFVKDNGNGIAPELLTKIFNMFEQADARGDTGGLGIGLALAKEIVELHGGTINASSEGEGKGSVFTVTLPRQHKKLV